MSLHLSKCHIVGNHMSHLTLKCLLQLRSYLTEPMLDQIPMLGEMQRYLEHLSMMDPPAPRKEVILEQVCMMSLYSVDNIM